MGDQEEKSDQDSLGDLVSFLIGFFEGIDLSLFQREVFLATPLAFEMGGNSRAFAIVAFHIHSGMTFDQVIEGINYDIDESMRRDEADVANMCGLLNAIVENKNLILHLAEEFDQRIEAGRKRLNSPISALDLFNKLVKYQ